MRTASRMACAVLLALCVSGPAYAVGTFLPATDRIDVVHDDKRNIIYVSESDRILRFDAATGNALSPVVFGSLLGGMDISPDGNTMVVADGEYSDTQVWVWTVNLDTLATHRILMDIDFYEAGTFTASYGSDGMIYTTSNFAGSGWVPLRKINPANDTYESIASVRQDTMLAASGDQSTIAFAEANISDGEWGLVDVPTGSIVRRQGYDDGTSWFNYEIATDRFGAQFAVPTYGGTMIYNDTYQKIGTIGVYAGEQPIGVAYHPVERLAYFPFAGTSQVRVYNMNTLQPVGSYDFEYTFTSNGNWAFNDGRTKLSRDGSVLMSTVGGGVRYVQMYAPLAALPITTTAGATAISIPLKGSIGNSGALSYSVAVPADKGSVSISGATATYTPPANYTGPAVFTYRVSYGLARRDAVVTVNVNSGGNHAPVAVNDSAHTTGAAIVIPVLANDTDADGNALTIVSVTQPSKANVTNQGTKLRFAPTKGWTGPSTFSYTISDRKGGKATATVTVTKN
jgi:hypothetical protein